MPDLADRSDYEQSLLLAIAPIFQAIAAQGPDVDWDAAETLLRDAVGPELEAIYDGAIDAMGEMLADFAPEDAAIGAAERPGIKSAVQEQAARLAKEVIDNRKQLWAEAEKQASQTVATGPDSTISRDAALLYLLYGIPRRRTETDPGGFLPLQGGLGGMPAGLQQRLVALEGRELSLAWESHLAQYVPANGAGLIVDRLGPQAADNIAVTETTRANSRAERAAANDFERETGTKIVAYWHTEEDARVCQRCARVNGQPEKVWLAEYPDGPPVHTNCRCWLDWAPER